jgi:beta-mannosidase
MSEIGELSLNGTWNLTGYPPEPNAEPLRLTGHVPGQVHGDLLRAGKIEDPFYRERAEECQWVETWDWEYEREFDLPGDFTPGWNVLEFEGLDTYAAITLNGSVVGETDNMYVPHRFNVGPLLRPGRNTLKVRFASPLKKLEGLPLDRYFSVFSQERVYVRRMQCSFGWDWVNRFVSAGLWRPVTLRTYDSGRIQDLFVYTEDFDSSAANLRVRFGVERHGDEPLTAEVRILDPSGRVCASPRARLVNDKADEEVCVVRPRVWWPNGLGEHPMYRCEVTLSRADGTVVDRRETEFGIRSVALEQIPDDIGSSFTLLINGQRVFAKGANWVPADPFPGEIDEARYQRLIGLAREGNANMLRAWGGGIYEPEAFWKACDREGIMVLQDFMLACAFYPEDNPAFLETLRKEFGGAIRLLRNHPSLVMWLGDNELGMNEPATAAYNGRKIAEEVSGPLCAELDPSRPFLPTSPYGGSPNNCATEGDCHISAWYDPEFFKSDMTDYRKRIDAAWGRFHSEYVTVGMPPLRSIRKWASEKDIADPTGRVIEYHNKDNPYNGIDDATHLQLMRRTAEVLYGPTDDPHTAIRRMEYEQYEWVRLSCESLRRRKFQCSGLLYWMFNDCWPANGCSLVDYYGFPKAGWYGMKHGFKPLLAAISPDSDSVLIWVVNDTMQPIDCSIELAFQPWTGQARWRRQLEATVPANGVVKAAEVALSELGRDGILVCDVRGGGLADRSWYYPGLPAEMTIPPATLRIQQTANGSSGSVTICADNYARVVTLEADLDFSDNYFDMLPGECRTIAWTSPAGPFNGSIPITCWNADKT